VSAPLDYAGLMASLPPGGVLDLPDGTTLHRFDMPIMAPGQRQEGGQIWPKMTIHERMSAILAELPAIGKDSRNTSQGFMYRSHDDVLNALNPLLAKWGVFVVPFVQERITGERRTSKGSTLYEVNLLVRYTFYGLGGDSLVASAWGEGTDSGDKSTNKAMTMAFKNVLAQSFAVSTADTIDSDAHTDEETTGRTTQELRELEALIEEVKAADQDPAHGGNYYYQVAVNAAAKYHQKKLDDLSPGEIHDLETRFKGLLRELTDDSAEVENRQAPPETELPVRETEVRKGPEPVPIPSSWAEIEQAVRAYGGDTWGDFHVFATQAKEHLFPGAARMSQQRKDTHFQKSAAVMIALRETHDPTEFPPPIRLEFQAHWSKVLDGTVLPGPEWAMSPDEASTRPPRKQPAGDTTSEAPAGIPEGGPETAEPDPPEAAPSAPSGETFTDGPLTDAEQKVLDAIGEEFPEAERVDGG